MTLTNLRSENVELTENEIKIYNWIESERNDDGTFYLFAIDAEYVLGGDNKSWRGVIGSMIKKGLIGVDEGLISAYYKK